MRLRRHVRVNTEGEFGDLLQLLGAAAEQLQLALALYVEKQDTVAERRQQFILSLADAREDYFLQGFLPGQAHTFEFASRNDVKARAQLGQHAQETQVGVGFYRVADRVVHATKSAIQDLVAFANCARGVNIERRAVFSRDRAQRNALAVEFAVFVDEARRPGEPDRRL